MTNIKNQILKPKSRLKLDHLGQYYASINCEENPGTFSVTAHLKEILQPDILQQAVNDLIQRLPHLNVRLGNGIFWYYHEILGTPLQIIPSNSTSTPANYFKKGEALTRILYGEHHLTVEVFHSVCDGRSLSKVVSALLMRYFEILGCSIDKQKMIDCTTSMNKEEIEDAYECHADLRKSKPEKFKDGYTPRYQPTTPKTIIKSFNLDLLKSKAKIHGINITEYIITHIMNEFRRLREKDNCQMPIAINVPIDCRSFFPTKCLRNFVSSKKIAMSENLTFLDIVLLVKEQLSGINANYIQEKISEMENLIRLVKYVPLFIKKWLIRKVGEAESAGISTAFSNLGLIKLPLEIESQVEMLSFALGAEPNMPYQFGCVAIGNTLTLTMTIIAKDEAIFENICAALEGT